MSDAEVIAWARCEQSAEPPGTSGTFGRGRRSGRRILPCLAAAALWASSGAVPASAGPPSLCDQLAARVRQSPAAVWTSDDSTLPWLAIAKPGAPDEGANEAYDLLRKAMEDRGLVFPSSPGPEIVRLPGTHVYMGSNVAGTANCQTSMFVELGPQRSARVLPEPEGYTGPCWNSEGSVGRVLGSLAYIETGTVSSTTADRVIRVTPWVDGGWGRACELTVRLDYRFQPGRQFCGNEAVCNLAGALAVEVAREYFAYRQQSQPKMTDIDAGQQVPAFEYDGVSSAEGQAAVTRAWRILARRRQSHGAPLLYSLYTADFPTFGYHDPNAWNYSFSYVDFAFFPLTLDGRLYLGAVGHQGIGWREDGRTLLAVYAAPQDGETELLPLAGFAVDRVPEGLKETEVANVIKGRSSLH